MILERVSRILISSIIEHLTIDPEYSSFVNTPELISNGCPFSKLSKINSATTFLSLHTVPYKIAVTSQYAAKIAQADSFIKSFNENLLAKNSNSSF